MKRHLRLWDKTSRATDIMKFLQIQGEILSNFANALSNLAIDCLYFFQSRGRRRPRRWYSNIESGHQDFTTMNPVGFDAEIPSEWESWLRHRRDDPPTEKQVLQSYALADLKKVQIVFCFTILLLWSIHKIPIMFYNVYYREMLQI